MDKNKLFKVNLIILLIAIAAYVMGGAIKGSEYKPSKSKIREQAIPSESEGKHTFDKAVYITKSKDNVLVCVAVTYNTDSLANDLDAIVTWSDIINTQISKVNVCTLDPKKFSDNQKWCDYARTSDVIPELLSKILTISDDANKDHNVMTKISVCIPSYNKFKLSTTSCNKSEIIINKTINN